MQERRQKKKTKEKGLEGIENTPGRFDGLCLLANQYLEAAFY